MTRTRPILFSGPMVRAILDGRKTQTRRTVKPALHPLTDGFVRRASGEFAPIVADYELGEYPVETVRRCPYGDPGDHLWVRETWQYAGWTEDGMPWVRYQADRKTRFHDSGSVPEEWADRLTDVWADLSDPANFAIDNCAADRRWRPSIHMPRWASRITLEVLDVRVERLQEISEEDAKAEGVEPRHGLPWPDGDPGYAHDPYRRAFARLWESINGSRAPWASDPWVWVVTFRRVKP